ncbi:MAG: hypothetical protein QOG91_643 [Candidatus Parcubacteria bacterium]|jgi:membrane protein DedA with SNARE-associated domain|nr:hypothetical protein [Candidatus Parcubacteria bacterium]
MQEWLIHIVNTHPYLTYAIIVFISFVEGPLLAMVCGLLVKLGDFHFIPVYVALMAGDLIGDTVWYGIGYHFGHRFVKRFGKYLSITEQGVSTIERIFHKYKSSILLVSKVTMGFGFALVTLITAGMVKIPFGRYLAMNILGQFIWTGILISLGYWFGHLYTEVDSIFGKISVLSLFIVASAGLFGYGKYLKKRVAKTV